MRLNGVLQDVTDGQRGIDQAVTGHATDVIVVFGNAVEAFETSGHFDGLNFTEFGENF